MINYYYELKEDVKIFGLEQRYIAQYDVKPDLFSGWRHFHDEAVKNSTRVWLENANGITLIKSPINDNGFGRRKQSEELVWLKLVCKDAETLGVKFD